MLHSKKRAASYANVEGDALDFLRAQHREIDALLTALSRTPLARDKRASLLEVADLLAVHMALEERVFYPGLLPARDTSRGASSRGTSSSDDGRLVRFTVADNVELKRLVAELLAIDVEDASFDGLALRVREQAAAHADAEERRVFTRVRHDVPRARLRRLEYEMRVLEFQLRTETEPRHFIVADAMTAVSA